MVRRVLPVAGVGLGVLFPIVGMTLLLSMLLEKAPASPTAMYVDPARSVRLTLTIVVTMIVGCLLMLMYARLLGLLIEVKMA